MSEIEAQQQKLVIEIEDAINGFNDGIPGIQKEIYRQIVIALKDLEIKNGVVLNNMNNIKLINSLKAKIENAILNNDQYISSVKDFINSFTSVSTIQTDYFKLVDSGFKPFDALQEIKAIAIDQTISSLTEQGIGANVVDIVNSILFQNVTSAVKYEDLLSQVQEHIMGTGKTDGALLKYSKQITTDSLNQYSATYNKLVSDDLGLEWGMYVGSNIRTSRCFCIALTKKKYIHQSELPAIIDGDFQEFREKSCTIYDKTGLPQGMIPGTNAENFAIRRGGYGCGHQYMPVSSAVVPEDIKTLIEG